MADTHLALHESALRGHTVEPAKPGNSAVVTPSEKKSKGKRPAGSLETPTKKAAKTEEEKFEWRNADGDIDEKKHKAWTTNLNADLEECESLLPKLLAVPDLSSSKKRFSL